MADTFKTDLRIVFQDTGHGPVVELATGSEGLRQRSAASTTWCRP
jgi:hypothetical protein